MVTLRRALLEDEPALLRVLLAANDDSLRRTGRRSPNTPPIDEARIAEMQSRFASYQRYANLTGDTWLAESGGRPVGYARVIRWPPAVELTEEMVLPEWQDGGLGARLLERVFGSREAADGELRLIRINATVQATGLYSRFGVSPVQVEYGVEVERAAVAIRAEQAATATTTAPLKHSPAIDQLDREVLGFARPDLHRFYLTERPALAILRDGALIGYCYYGPGFGPAAAWREDDLIPVVAAGLLAAGERPSFSLSGANDTLWRWLEPARPRLLGLGVLGANRALPGLGRYVLADPDFTV
ncbi:MAG: GNAT family N-acetyltransferase [Dehalococcoidia bacterium]